MNQDERGCELERLAVDIHSAFEHLGFYSSESELDTFETLFPGAASSVLPWHGIDTVAFVKWLDSIDAIPSKDSILKIYPKTK